MTREQIRQVVLGALGDIAPEADLPALRGDCRLREELDIDSFDFLRFVLALNQALGVEVPEIDYARLATLDGCVDYLASRFEAVQPTSR